MSYQLYNGIFRRRNRMAGLPKLYDLGQGIILNPSGTAQYGTTSSLSGVAIPANWTFICWLRLLYPAAVVRIDTQNIGILSSYSGSDIFAVTCGRSVSNSNFVPQVVLLNPTQGLTIVSPTSTPSGLDINLSTRVFCVTVTYDTSLSEIKFYLQGTLLQTQTLASNKFPTNFQATTEVGRHVGDNNRLLKGVIGETRFINSTLTETQILNHYNSGIGTNLDSNTHLFGYKFEGNGNDFSGNSRNLTLTGSPTYQNFY